MTWKNYLSEDVSEQSASLKEATTLFMNSVAFCYQMGTAKVLADQIGGLDNTQAYQNVVAALASDELDPLDADLFAQELQRECIDAMTPEVLGRATVEEPFNMTTSSKMPKILKVMTSIRKSTVGYVKRMQTMLYVRAVLPEILGYLVTVGREMPDIILLRLRTTVRL